LFHFNSVQALCVLRYMLHGPWFYIQKTNRFTSSAEREDRFFGSPGLEFLVLGFISVT